MKLIKLLFLKLKNIVPSYSAFIGGVKKAKEAAKEVTELALNVTAMVCAFKSLHASIRGRPA